jgi:gamma-glutamyltranspeptidase/glutathione hydrolase
MAKHAGIVSAGHALTADAARRMFAEGGNAFDAAAAALLASFVVEPCMSSPGGGVFATCRESNGAVRVLDAFCNTPQRWPGPEDEAHALDFRAVDIDFGQTTERFYAGWASVAVPGAMAALDALTAKGRLPKAVLAEPALEAARKGHAIDAFQAYDFILLEPILRLDPLAAAAFFERVPSESWPRSGPSARPSAGLKAGLETGLEAGLDAGLEAELETGLKAGLEDGLAAGQPMRAATAARGLRLKGEGEALRQPGLARFIEAWTLAEPDWFYRGEPARALADAMRENGGLLQAADLEAYQAVWRDPLRLELNGMELCTNPAPSAGGSMLCLSLALMEQAGEPGARGFAQSLAWALAETGALRRKADQHYWPPRPEDWAADLEAALERLQGEHIFEHPEGPGPAGGTTHFSILDAEGQAVALSSSNGEGSGTWMADWGLQWNNMLGEAALFPEGFHRGPLGQRVGSLMTPSLLIGPSFCMALGSGGAGRIPSALAAVAYRIAFLDESPDLAVEAPRMHWQDGVLEMEPGLDAGFLPPGSRSHVWTAPNMFFGGVHAAWQNGPQRHAIADARRHGHCARWDHE